MSRGCRINLDGHEYIVPEGENLLSALLQRGAMVSHSCLAGACGSCRLYPVVGDPILSCQQTVRSDMSLSSKPSQRFTIALEDVSCEVLSDHWGKVKARCPVSLPLGAVFRWQLGDHIGRSVCCSTAGEALAFYFPLAFQERMSELLIEQGAQRATIDISATHLLLYSADNRALAQNFADALQQYGVSHSPMLEAIDLSLPSKTLAFQRFDKALILNDQPVSQDSLEDWLAASRCRVADFTFMTHSN